MVQQTRDGLNGGAEDPASLIGFLANRHFQTGLRHALDEQVTFVGDVERFARGQKDVSGAAQLGDPDSALNNVQFLSAVVTLEA